MRVRMGSGSAGLRRVRAQLRRVSVRTRRVSARMRHVSAETRSRSLKFLKSRLKYFERGVELFVFGSEAFLSPAAAWAILGRYPALAPHKAKARGIPPRRIFDRRGYPPNTRRTASPYEPVTGDKPQETLASALRLKRMRKAGSLPPRVGGGPSGL